MKLTKSKLKQLIKEELQNLLQEEGTNHSYCNVKDCMTDVADSRMYKNNPEEARKHCSDSNNYEYPGSGCTNVR